MPTLHKLFSPMHNKMKQISEEKPKEEWWKFTRGKVQMTAEYVKKIFLSKSQTNANEKWRWSFSPT